MLAHLCELSSGTFNGDDPALDGELNIAGHDDLFVLVDVLHLLVGLSTQSASEFSFLSPSCTAVLLSIRSIYTSAMQCNSST